MKACVERSLLKEGFLSTILVPKDEQNLLEFVSNDAQETVDETGTT